MRYQDLTVSYFNPKVSNWYICLVSYPYQDRTDIRLLNMIKIHLLGPVQHITEDLFIREVILMVRWESKWKYFFYRTVRMILFSSWQLLYVGSLLDYCILNGFCSPSYSCFFALLAKMAVVWEASTILVLQFPQIKFLKATHCTLVTLYIA